MRFDIITVVWGEAFVDIFLRLAVPNQLTAGNLLFFGDKPDSVIYKVLTTTRDAATLRASPTFAKVAAAVPVEIVLVDAVNREERYAALSECHRRAIAAADARDAALIFLSPDSLWADGTFRRLWDLAESGRRAVLVAGIRVMKETFVPAYLEEVDRVGVALGPRELLRLALAHLHPVTRALFWDAPTFFYFPSNLYWRVADEGFLARCYHLHPLLVNPRRRGLLPASTIDADYLMLACPDPEDLHVVTDSDELLGIEISPADHFGAMPQRPARVADVALWTRYYASPHHLGFARHKLRFHQQDCTKAWEPVEDASERVLEAIDFRRRHPMLLAGRIVRRNIVRAGTSLLRLFLNEKRLRALRRILIRLRILR
jgi:hypothetical protein